MRVSWSAYQLFNRHYHVCMYVCMYVCIWWFKFVHLSYSWYVSLSVQIFLSINWFFLSFFLSFLQWLMEPTALKEFCSLVAAVPDASNCSSSNCPRTWRQFHFHSFKKLGRRRNCYFRLCAIHHVILWRSNWHKLHSLIPSSLSNFKNKNQNAKKKKLPPWIFWRKNFFVYFDRKNFFISQNVIESWIYVETMENT